MTSSGSHAFFVLKKYDNNGTDLDVSFFVQGYQGYVFEIMRHHPETRRQPNETNINLLIGRNLSTRLKQQLSTAFRDYGDVPFVADPAMIKHADSNNT
jgi:hypothetical protein